MGGPDFLKRMKPTAGLLLAAAWLTTCTPAWALLESPEFAELPLPELPGGLGGIAAVHVGYNLDGDAAESGLGLPLMGGGAQSGAGPGPGANGGLALHRPLGLDLEVEVIQSRPGAAHGGLGYYSAALGGYLVPHWRKLPPGNHVIIGSAQGTNDVNVAESLDWGQLVVVTGNPLSNPAGTANFLTTPPIPEPATYGLLAVGTAVLLRHGRRPTR